MQSGENYVWNKLTDSKAQALVAKVETVFKDLPHLPKSLVDFFVTITPWGVGLGGFLSLMGAFTNLKFGFGMNSVTRAMYYYSGVNSLYFILSAVLQLAVAIIAFKAFNPLKDRKNEGWMYLFWSNAIALVESIVGFIFVGGSGVSLLIGALIGYYFLFEIKLAYAPVKKSVTKKEVSKKKSKPKN